MRRIYGVIQEALKTWVEATGIDPSENALAGFWTGVADANQDIKKAQELDPSGVTTFMVLRSSVRSFAEEQTFNALKFLEDPDSVLEETEALRKLLKLLNDGECLEEVAAFQESLREMARSYGVAEKVSDLVSDIQELAYIRRDAILGYKELKPYRFAQGKRGSRNAKYNPSVLKFWNVNSAIRAARVQPEDGVSLIMLRDPVAEFSCFAFLVRNGENIDILTDAPESPHPLHKYMSRSKGRSRQYESRAFRLRFPYELFNFEFSDDGRFKREVPAHGLIKLNTEASRVKPVKELPPDEVLWTLMMFDLIRERYWNLPQEALPLSYTGEATVALPPANGKTIALPNAIRLDTLTRKDVHRKMLKGNWERKSTGQNNWLEDRYGHLVPEEVFNLVGTDKIKLLPDGKKMDVAIAPRKLRKEFREELIAVDPMAFGTPEEMDLDRKFIARHNQAVVIHAYAKDEFKRRKKEVLSWYEDRVRKNLDFLFDCVAKGVLVSQRQGSAGKNSFDWGAPQKGNILSQWECRNPRQMGGPWWYRESVVSLYFTDHYTYRCFLTRKPVSVWSHFQPMTPISLAIVAGCKMRDLPDVLRHWTKNERYAGNSILDRIDPMEWQCKNPWRELGLDVIVGLSKSSFNRLLKERGMKRRALKVHGEE